MEFNVVDRKDAILRSKCKPFNFEKEDAEEFAKGIVNALFDEGQIAVAANEFGHNKQVIAVRAEPILVMFNPKITSTNGNDMYLEESDAARRGLICMVKRPESCRVRFQDYNGDWNVQQYRGMTARMIMRAIDTINGIEFYSRATRYHRGLALKNFNLLQREMKKMKRDDR